MDKIFDAPEGSTQPFSVAWAAASVLIFTAMEIAIGVGLAPMLLASKLASPMLQLRLDVLMHLASFYLGGLFVGVISPRVRLFEPAVGAFVAVVLTLAVSFFMPQRFLGFSSSKLIIGGGIAFALALAGAYSGEKWMGNVEAKGGRESSRARLRDRMWGDEGLLSRGDPRFTLKR